MARLFVANVQKGEESPVAGLGQLLLEDRAREQKLALEQQEAERRAAKDEADIEFRNASLDHEKDVQRERERANKAAEDLKREDMERRREEEQYKMRLSVVENKKERDAKREIAELGAETQLAVTEKRGQTQVEVAELGAEERQAREDKALSKERTAQGLAAKEFYSNSERSVKGYDPVDRPNRSQLQQFGKRYNAVQDRIANAKTEEELAEAVVEVSVLRADFKAMLDKHDEDLEEKKGQAAYDEAMNMASAPYEEGGAGLTEEEIRSIVVGTSRKDDIKELREAASSRIAFRRAQEDLNNARLNNPDWAAENLEEADDGTLKLHGEDTYLGDLHEILQDPLSSEKEKTRAMNLMSRAIRMGAANPDASQLIRDMDGQRQAQTERKVQGQKNQEFLAGLGMQMLPEADFALQSTEYLLENEEGLALSPEQARAAQKVNNIIKETLRDYGAGRGRDRREPGTGRVRRSRLAESPNEEILKRLQQAVESGEIGQAEFSSIMQFMTRGVLTQNAEELGDVPTFEAWMREAAEYTPNDPDDPANSPLANFGMSGGF